ncbi:acyl-CoA dehydrogenase family protein [Streptomyces albus]|uniref:acyl-CoA dehydrogenase family protein n=1 Tax=Streptomyces albus TaxID=1888 RepID=UPI0039EF6269
MDFGFTPQDEEFRAQARTWLAERLTGDYAAAAGQGGPGSEHQASTVRRRWERELGRGGWIGLGWDRARGTFGNRHATVVQQVVWAEEYARAGSDLAAVRTSAVRESGPAGSRYRITGQKIWTSLAHEADWCFVLARTEPGSHRRRGLSFLLVPMDQPGRIEVRPIRQMSGTAEFNEVFFDGALAKAGHLVGAEGDGWRVATALLARERGASTLVQQIGFAAELDQVLGLALAEGAADRDPVLREELVRAWAELRTMRRHALRTLGGADSTAVPGAPSVAKLLWGGWHQRLGELAVRVRGAAAALGPRDWTPRRPYELDALQRLFLFTRADTLYGGSDEIQRDLIAQHALGLPREAHT